MLETAGAALFLPQSLMATAVGASVVQKGMSAAIQAIALFAILVFGCWKSLNISFLAFSSPSSSFSQEIFLLCILIRSYFQLQAAFVVTTASLKH